MTAVTEKQELQTQVEENAMNVKEAAKVIGCAPTHVRYLIGRGLLIAKLVPNNAVSLRYEIDETEVMRYKNAPQLQGYPRGKKRA